MIIDCISDLHGHYPKLEGGDLLIVAGDLTARDIPDEYALFYEWINEQDYKKKIVIAGNHDNFLQKIPEFFKVTGVCEYLCDSGTEFEGLKIWGSPWTKTFHGMNPKCKAFTVDTEDELFEKWEKIPHDVDILITHSPPYKILDKTTEGHMVGSRRLLGMLIYTFRPRLWVFGHVHESYGNETFNDSTICVNASHVDENYRPVNQPIRIIL